MVLLNWAQVHDVLSFLADSGKDGGVDVGRGESVVESDTLVLHLR